MKPLSLTRPRIHVTPDAVAELKRKASTTHAFFYGKLIEAADETASQKLPDSIGSGDNNRYYGDILPMLALAYILSGEEKYARSCREITSRLVALEKWGDDLDLVTGHFLAGAAIAYDWLYDYYGAGERGALGDKIAYHADIVYRYASAQRIWWHDYFLHNWNHVITGGLAYAAAALSGEDPRADAWSDYAEGVFAEVERALPDDGSYQEGFAYMTYAWECMVRYFDLSLELYGKDHFGGGWFRNAPYLLLYFSTPRPRWHDNCMMFGDGPRHFEWHGPVHLMLKSASRYNDGVVQGFAKKLCDAGVGLTRTGSWLNMLWYKADLETAPHEALSAFRHFENIGIVSMRSGWDADAVMVGFKCTNNAGKKAVREYPGRDLGSGHAHPDAASFQVYAFGEWLAVDTGYTQFKETRDHNTLVINGVQQLGGERLWFDVMECFSNAAYPEITRAETTPAFDYVRADATGIYRPQARLAKFIRHLVFVKPAGVLVVDELEAKVESNFEWRMHADESIVQAGSDFEVRKNEARLRVSFLAPEMKASVTKSTIEAATSSGMNEAIVLSAAPKKPCVGTTLVTFMSAFCGAGPLLSARLSAIENGVVKVVLESEDKTRTLTLDMPNARVEIT